MLLNRNRCVVKFQLLKYLDQITRVQARGRRVEDLRGVFHGASPHSLDQVSVGKPMVLTT